MDYEQKYKEALEKASKLRVQNPFDTVGQMVEHIFPELQESENERIRKELIEQVAYIIPNDDEVDSEGDALSTYQKRIDKYRAWLEKQGEQLVDKIEPKFKVGDWLQYRHAESFLVEEITEQGYCNGDSCLPFEWEDEIHLWTIQDAKDGDVLATEDGRPFIIRCMVESKNDIPSAYCGINARPIEAFIITGYSPGTSKWTNSKVHPATKEQRDLLFQKMKEAGYKWNNEKKELKKIESKMLDADKVIAWLKTNVYDESAYGMSMINHFKKDCGL